MPRTSEFYRLCRLCLCSGGRLVDIFEDSSELEFMVENTIEDLLQLKVAKESCYPWLVCHTCLEKLTEFRLFKRRCLECQFVFYNRVRQGDFPRAGIKGIIIKKVCTEKVEISKRVDRGPVKCYPAKKKAVVRSDDIRTDGNPPKEASAPSEHDPVAGNVSEDSQTSNNDASNSEAMETMATSEEQDNLSLGTTEVELVSSPTRGELFGEESQSQEDLNGGTGSRMLEVFLKVEDGSVSVDEVTFMPSPTRQEAFDEESQSAEDTNRAPSPMPESRPNVEIGLRKSKKKTGTHMYKRKKRKHVFYGHMKKAAEKRDLQVAADDPVVDSKTNEDGVEGRTTTQHLNEMPHVDEDTIPSQSEGSTGRSMSSPRPGCSHWQEENANQEEADAAEKKREEGHFPSIGEKEDDEEVNSSWATSSVNDVHHQCDNVVAVPNIPYRKSRFRNGYYKRKRKYNVQNLNRWRRNTGRVHHQCDNAVAVPNIPYRKSRFRNGYKRKKRKYYFQNLKRMRRNTGRADEASPCMETSESSPPDAKVMDPPEAGSQVAESTTMVSKEDMPEPPSLPEQRDDEASPYKCMETSDRSPLDAKVVESPEAGSQVAESTTTASKEDMPELPSLPEQRDETFIGTVVKENQEGPPTICALVMSGIGGYVCITSSQVGVEAPGGVAEEHNGRLGGVSSSHGTASLQPPVELSKEAPNDNYIELLGKSANGDWKKHRVFQCDQCGRKFNKKIAVLEHLREHRGGLRCAVCYMQCGSVTGLKLHVLRKHSSKHRAPKAAGSEGGGGDGWEDGVVTRGAVSKWLEDHYSNDLYRCDDCPKSYKSKERLSEHVVVHTKYSPHFCEVCSRTFPSPYILRNHKVIHSTGKPFVCSKCPMAFKRLRALQKHHSGVHMRERPYACDVCGKRFTTKSGLRTHVTVHTSEKPYACDQCPKSFGQKFQLRSHMSVHTGIKPFTCDICSKSYTLKHYLRDHMKKHTGVCIFCCRWCKETFSKKTELSKHMNTVHKDSVRAASDVKKTNLETESYETT